MLVAAPCAHVAGTIDVPGDKSISHRAMMLAGVCDGRSEVTGFLPSEDCRASLAAMRALGVEIEERDPTCVWIQGRGLRGLRAADRALDMGNAGTAMRLFAGLLSGQMFDSELVGDESLSRRPMERVAQPLRRMGAQLTTSAGGTAPIRIHGSQHLRGAEHRLAVASAQVKSALLLAGLYADAPTAVVETGVSRDHSERMLRAMGAEVRSEALRVCLTPPKFLRATHVQVPGDFSSAAFFIVAALIGADGSGMSIRNVGVNPTRTGLATILQRMGGQIEMRSPREAGDEPMADVHVSRSELHGIDVPADLVPLAIDELPVLMIAAACARGVTRIRNAAELRVKESDRIAAMAAGLRALDVEHEVFDDGIAIEGNSERRFPSAEIQSHGDHRIAMSFAIASVRADAPLNIHDTANVATSFPNFVTTARQAGLRLGDA